MCLKVILCAYHHTDICIDNACIMYGERGSERGSERETEREREREEERERGRERALG